MRSATIAATRPASSSPIWRSRWSATTSAPQMREFLRPALAARDQLLQPTPLGLARQQRSRISPSSIARVDDPRIERGIVVRKFLERPRPGDPPLDPRGQHFEMERLERPRRRRRRHKPSTAPSGVGPAGDQDDRQCRAMRGVAADQPGQLGPARSAACRARRGSRSTGRAVQLGDRACPAFPQAMIR